MITIQNQTHITNFYDDIPDEPELCKMAGFDDCQNCYFRVSTLDRITQDVKQLHRRRL
jgi:hypothetical protein